MSDWRGVLGFWRRMTSRLSGGLSASTRGPSTEDKGDISIFLVLLVQLQIEIQYNRPDDCQQPSVSVHVFVTK